MSANLRTMCTICGAGNKADFFKFDWKAKKWKLLVILGALIVWYVGYRFITTDMRVSITPNTHNYLHEL